METELVIDDTNFNEYFFDTRTTKPKRGQVLACFNAEAKFVDANLKRDIVNLLLFNDCGAKSAPQLLQKLANATYDDSLKLTKQIAKDLLTMEVKEVLEKEYTFCFSMYFYTQKEYVPIDDPRWTTTILLNQTFSTEPIPQSTEN